jgi:signal transduction histidine kinase/CheY-like chemotaxis protein
MNGDASHAEHRMNPKPSTVSYFGVPPKGWGRLAMAFADPSKEDRFLDQQRDNTAEHLRWACAVGAAIMIGFIWQDLLVSPTGYKAIAIRILGGLPVSALAWYLGGNSGMRRFVSYISASFWLVYACLTAALFISYGPGPYGLTSSIGLGSFLIIIVGVFAFSNLRLLPSVLVGSAILLIYATSVTLWTDAPLVVFIVGDFLTAVALMIATAIRTLFTERAQRRQFATSELLHQSLTTVERQVRERTAELQVMNAHLSAEIAERQRAEDRERLARETLELLNRSEMVEDMIRDIVMAVRKSTGFAAVGVRMRAGDDFPYYTTSGFSEEFVRGERYLCARDEQGQVKRDASGHPVLECMCGIVLCGRTKPDLPFFTAGGSFWTNSSIHLSFPTAEADCQARTPNWCHDGGYESVALVPLRAGGEIIGLLQLNDHRPDRFTFEMIRFFEGLGSSIGVALSRKRMEEQRATLEEQLRQAQKMESVGRLAGGVAHDFNNILTGIGGYTAFALGQLDAASPVREDLEEVKRLGERAADLTRQLLAFSRRQPLATEVLNLDDTVANVGKMLKRVLGEDIDLQFVPTPGLGNVRADPGQMEQILMNLAVNGRDAMQSGGKLTIETANTELGAQYAEGHVGVSPGPYVMLAVSDTGHGMDATTRQYLFEPFFTTKERGKGTGLGLATVYGIVKQHGGSIWVYSEPGNGATFKIYLPRVAEAVNDAKPPAEAKTVRGKEILLVVEDEASVRGITERILKGQGYTVLAAGSAEEAERVFSEHREKISLLLTDVVLPGMNGRTLYDLLRVKDPALRVLYMSGYADNAIVHRGVLDAGTAFMQKPFTAEMVSRKVRQVLDS